MPLFRITLDNRLENVKISQFRKERDLQIFVEQNMEFLFGIKFLESEYSIPNGRIDSLCIDEMGVPLVIEYKKKKDLSAIIQGLFYVDWLRNNRRTFEMIVREKSIDKMEVDWRTPPRLLIIADEFDQKEATSINQINASVELIKYSYYGDLISFDQINIPKTSSNFTITTQYQPIATSENEILSIESVLAKGSDRIKGIILKLRDFVFEISDEIDEKVASTMIAYYSKGKGMIWIAPFQNKFTIHLRKGEYENKYNFIKANGWGGYPELHVGVDHYNDEIENYVKEIITQAYNN